MCEAGWLILFFILWQGDGASLFSTGNIITLIGAAVAAAAAVVRNDQQIRSLAELRKTDLASLGEVRRADLKWMEDIQKMMQSHFDEDRESIQRIESFFRDHCNDADQHIGRRLYDELMRRFGEADKARDRIETKLDQISSHVGALRDRVKP